jgi:hypothetical protein
LSQTYQRGSLLPEGGEAVPEWSLRTALEKRLATEQLFRAMRTALGAPAAEEAALADLRLRFEKAFANPPREPEDDVAPSLRASLFILNDSSIQDMFHPSDDNLVARLSRESDPDRLAEELYLSVLTRLPDPEERELVAEVLARYPEGERTAPVQQLAWALLGSTEFSVNH